jgi:hypothetical protein
MPICPKPLKRMLITNISLTDIAISGVRGKNNAEFAKYLTCLSGCFFEHLINYFVP